MKRPTFLTVAMIALLCGCQYAQALQSTPKTLQFCGYEWEVRPAGTGGPGPNQWDPNNVWVDQNGALHLKISREGGQWRCAELSSKSSLGFGRYEFEVVGRIDRLDPNVVLGLFDYPPPEVGPDGTNEIDIEFARWGNPAWPNGNYTVYPAQTNVNPPSGSKTFTFTLKGDYTTHRFIRSSSQITFQSLYGHREDDRNEFMHWIYGPSDYLKRIPQQPIPVHINLWLFRGKAPTNGRSVEIVISRFAFTPAP